MPKKQSVQRKGFSCLESASRVKNYLENFPWKVPSEEIEVDFKLSLDLAGRTLESEVKSSVNVPNFPKAMMDGFAVRSSDLTEASPTNQLALKVCGLQLAGKSCTQRETEISKGPKTCLEIMTGSPVPSHFDAVIPFENVLLNDASNENETSSINISQPISPGKNIAPIGEDIQEGQTIFPKGHQLRIQDLGLLASCQIKKVSLQRKPKVSFFLSGDEIEVWRGTPSKKSGVTYDSNGPVLKHFIARDGGVVEELETVGDQIDSLRQTVKNSTSEVMIFTGGTSVGVADHLPGVINELGELLFHGIDIKPGRPVGIGRVDDRWIFLLPGNPIACYFAYDLFVRPTLAFLNGRKPSLPYKCVKGILNQKVDSKVGRLDYLRVRINEKKIDPITTGRSSNLSTIAFADGFCLIPESDESWEEGKEVEAWIY